MDSISAAFLVAADSAVALLADPAVAARWDEQSALPEFSVHGLAGHLADQVLQVRQHLAEPVPDGEPVELLDHYTRVTWVGAPVDDKVNVAMRERGERTAADGPGALTSLVRATVDELRGTVAAEPADRLVHLPGRWSLRIGDYLTIRMMELAVHSDDLAVSVGVDTPPLPPEVLEPVLSLLGRLAVRRHGATAVLRALSRAERAPDRINAI